MKLYLLSYNSPINRKVKGHETIGGYLDDNTATLVALSEGVNFSPSDGLNTSVTIVDSSGNISPTNFPNYCITVREDDPDKIYGRWFVLSVAHSGVSRASRQNEYTVTLLRDVMYDFHEAIGNSTAFVRKGFAGETSPLFLHNDPDFRVNMIKSGEVLLKESGEDTPYIVIYRARKRPETYNVTIEGVSNTLNSPISGTFTSGGTTYVMVSDVSDSTHQLTEGEIDELCNSTQGVVYTYGDECVGSTFPVTVDGGAFAITQPAADSISSHTVTINGRDYTYRGYVLSDTSVAAVSSRRVKLSYQSEEGSGNFDILFAPYNEENMKAANSICIDGSVYDIQVAPYKPEGYRRASVVLEVASSVAGGDVILGRKSLSDSFLVASKDSRKLDIDCPDGIIPNTFASSWQVNKARQNCMSVRLVSPDAQAIEELMPQVNLPSTTASGEKLIKSFHVYVKFQPYKLYVQVLPVYNGYETDFEDYRGLICGSGFSCSMATDKWAEYAMNNKNYRNQFERDIESMRVQQGMGLASNIVSGVGSAVSGAISGAAVSGPLAPIGAAIGAVTGVVGGVASSITGWNTSEYNIDTARRSFRWNVEDIQARPRTLTQVDAQNPNFRFWPFLEWYSCTGDEMVRYYQYLRKHGATIGAEGRVSDFVGDNYKYIEADLDEYPSNDIPDNILGAIATLLGRGVYWEV